MAKKIIEKEIEVSGSSKISLSVKTTLSILGGIITIISSILGYAYFDLRKNIKSQHNTFIQNVDDKMIRYENKMDGMKDDISDIKGDIKVILDRQNRDNPVVENHSLEVQPTLPPTMDFNMPDTID